jgi:hypothetical protein
MPDKGIARIVGREVFGLAVRLTGLWVGYISGFTLVVDITSSGLRHGEVIVMSLIGLAAGFALVLQADRLCRMSYSRGDTDAVSH